MAHYGKIEYWEERYTKQPEPFDWYQVYSGIKDIITQYLNKEDKVLNVGAGNSRLSEEMYEEGYQNITNIDISTTCVKYMGDKLKTRCPNMIYKEMDVLNMKDIPNNEFNAVIDKGTLDSILCGDNSEANAEKMLVEVNRVLKPTGVFICVSYGDEEHRREYLKNKNINFWDIKVDKVAKPSVVLSGNITDEKDSKNFHYIYTMTKHA